MYPPLRNLKRDFDNNYIELKLSLNKRIFSLKDKETADERHLFADIGSSTRILLIKLCSEKEDREVFKRCRRLYKVMGNIKVALEFINGANLLREIMDPTKRFVLRYENIKIFTLVNVFAFSLKLQTLMKGMLVQMTSLSLLKVHTAPCRFLFLALVQNEAKHTVELGLPPTAFPEVLSLMSFEAISKLKTRVGVFDTFSENSVRIKSFLARVEKSQKKIRDLVRLKYVRGTKPKALVKLINHIDDLYQ